MKQMRTAVSTLALAVVLTGTTLGSQPNLVTSATLPDGTVASAEPECAVDDLCATIRHPDGDALEIYSEGAAMCQPYHLRAVHLHDGQALFSYEIETNHEGGTNGSAIFGAQCGRHTDTQFVLDKGALRMGIYPVPNGSLSIKFEVVKNG